jgi:hypothetical protein
MHSLLLLTMRQPSSYPNTALLGESPQNDQPIDESSFDKVGTHSFPPSHDHPMGIVGNPDQPVCIPGSS